MKGYLITTATVFIVLVIAHIVRGFQETHLVRQPLFIIATIAPLALAIWAVRLLRRIPRT
jgi:FtsH-binding integral membrane protein